MTPAPMSSPARHLPTSYRLSLPSGVPVVLLGGREYSRLVFEDSQVREPVVRFGVVESRMEAASSCASSTVPRVG